MQEQGSVGSTGMPHPPKVMVVDDDENWIFISNMMLKRAGVKEENMISAQNGLEAIRLLREMEERGSQLPAIIFLDIKMPVLDGFGFLDQLYTSGGIDISHTRIYLCSTSYHPADMERTKQYPIAGYFNKPLTIEIIEQVLR